MPDGGSARCDFPKGSASALFESVAKIYGLPDSTRMFVGHGTLICFNDNT